MDNQERSAVVAQSSFMFPAWRTEPEIGSERQKFLSERLTIQADVKLGSYAFRDVKLTRADIEWLLATHDEGRGPVDWSDEQERKRLGLDLCGADLRGVNLSGLPLARTYAGLNREDWAAATLEQRDMSKVHLERAYLRGTQLQGANLRGAHLERSSLREVHLEEAILYRANLKDAYLREAHLETAYLRGAHLEGAYLREACLKAADLRDAFFDTATDLEGVTLGDEQSGYALLANVHWGDANLSLVNWRRVKRLGDEDQARQGETHAGITQDKGKLLDDYHAAVRASRQLANALRAQGMNEEAVPFAYRAQVLQREVHWRQVLWGQVAASQTDVLPGETGQALRTLRHRVRSFGAYIFSWFLDILAGYGHKPGRNLCLYLLTIVGFALCYLVLGQLPPGEALIFSVTSFHGRGFLPGPFALGSPITAIAALEAVVGLVIEISFIATFTQRFFGR